MGFLPCASSQPLLLNQKPKHLQKHTMALMDMVLDIEAMDMVDTMVMDTVTDTHTTDTDTDTDTTVARDPPKLKLMLNQKLTMADMDTDTPDTVTDMPTDMPVTDTELVTTATHTADTDTIINLLLNKPSTLQTTKGCSFKKSFEFV